MTYTMGSLFAGIGGFDLGFERAGFKTVWQVEIDPYCQKVLAKNFPEAERFGDIRECGRHNLKPVDVICGGFPCQDISSAGLGAGLEGKRSGLWSEYARIVRELRPAYIVVENVAALLGRGMGRVLGDLASIGYDAEWDRISAADVGAHHLRERIWILAYPMRGSGSAKSGQQQGQWAKVADSGSAGDVAYSDSMRELQPQGRISDQRRRFSDSGEKMANPYGLRCGQMEQSIQGREDSEGPDGSPEYGSISRGWSGWAVEPNVGRVANGVPKRVDRLRGLGNAVVPQIPEMIARRIKQALEAA